MSNPAWVCLPTDITVIKDSYLCKELQFPAGSVPLRWAGDRRYNGCLFVPSLFSTQRKCTRLPNSFTRLFHGISWVKLTSSADLSSVSAPSFPLFHGIPFRSSLYLLNYICHFALLFMPLALGVSGRLIQKPVFIWGPQLRFSFLVNSHFIHQVEFQSCPLQHQYCQISRKWYLMWYFVLPLIFIP